MLELKPEITYGDLLAAGLGIVALLVGLLGFIYSQVIQSNVTRSRFIELLKQGRILALYQGSLRWLLGGLQRFYGDKESAQAYGMSFMVSLFYPLVFFIFAYSYFHGTNLFSGVKIFPAETPYRAWYFPVIMLLAVLMFWVGKNSGKTDTWKWQVLVMGLVTVIIFLIDVYPGGFGGVADLAAMLGISAGITVFAGTSGTAVAIVIVVSVAVYAAWIGSHNVSLMFLFFWLAMPLVNALLDWLSWWVSRYFMERALQAPRVRLIVWDITLDFLAAVLFMLALCLLLPGIAELLDRLYAGHLSVTKHIAAQTDWRTYAVLARDEPWGKGIMVTMMLVTTLIPTLLHIFFGVAAFFIHSFKGKELAMYLDATPLGHNGRYAVASVWIFGYWVATLAAIVVLYQGFQHFAQLPIAQWLYGFTDYFFELP